MFVLVLRMCVCLCACTIKVFVPGDLSREATTDVCVCLCVCTIKEFFPGDLSREATILYKHLASLQATSENNEYCPLSIQKIPHSVLDVII